MNDRSGEDGLRAAAMAAAGDLAYVWDVGADTFTWVGDGSALFDADSGAMATGDRWRSRIAPEDGERRRSALSRHADCVGFGPDSVFDCEYRVRFDDGSFHWIHDRGRFERAADGAPARLFGTIRVIDHRKAYEVELEHLAHFDRMTGLMNRHRLRDVLENALARPATAEEGTVYLAVGIDKLGLVNDSMGHATADAVVVEVARRIQRVVRPGDIVGRAGGDVFGVVLPRCPEAGMAAAADKLLAIVRSAPMDTPSGPVHVTVSIGGVLVADRDGGDTETVMTRAETALHEAKRQGRDGFWPHHVTSIRQTVLRDSVAIGQKVKAALGDGTLRFAFQPVVDAAGRVAYYECLLRIDGGGGPPLPASAFMPAVERLCMARRIDLHTLGLALAELRAHPDIQLALNVSAATTADRSWIAALEEGVADRPEIASRLIVEITETAAIEDVAETASFVTRVKALGCRVALDDFGAGYLSYRHLRALPVDIVKIDGSFVTEMADSPDALLFIRTVVGIAGGFGLTTVAEGVEGGAQADALRREGVALFQGYHFGRPLTVRPWLEPAEVRAAC